MSYSTINPKDIQVSAVVDVTLPWCENWGSDTLDRNDQLYVYDLQAGKYQLVAKSSTGIFNPSLSESGQRIAWSENGEAKLKT